MRQPFTETICWAMPPRLSVDESDLRMREHSIKVVGTGPRACPLMEQAEN